MKRGSTARLFDIVPTRSTIPKPPSKTSSRRVPAGVAGYTPRDGPECVSPHRHISERLAEAGIEQSVGSVGDSYDNALAESIIGLYKTEVTRPRGHWRGVEAVEFATLDWVAWFNNGRLLEVIGNRPPAETEAAYYRQAEHAALAA